MLRKAQNNTPIQMIRSSPYAEASNQTNLAQSVRRRLQYSQLPVRTTKRTLQQGRLVNSLKKFSVLGTTNKQRCASSAKKIYSDDAPNTARFIAAASGSPVGRKSLSMIDLTSAPAVNPDFDSESGSTSARLEDASDRRTEETLSVEGCALMTWTSNINQPICLSEYEEKQRVSKAASLICRALAINAWRRKREEVNELRDALTAVNQQLDHLQIQIVVLRRLLDNENARVTNLASELHKAKQQADEVTKERDQLKIEKETAKNDEQKQLEISEERLVTIENLRNELKSSQDQLDALDKQISKDREKLLKLREDKRILLEKVSICESLTLRADKAESSLAETEIQLATQISINSSLQEEVQRVLNILKDKENEKIKLEEILRKMEEDNLEVRKRLQISEETEKLLNTRAADLECQLINQELKIKHIEAAYTAQIEELNELRERLFRQTQDSGWSSRVLQLAGSVVRAPRVILRTLSFFLRGCH